MISLLAGRFLNICLDRPFYRLKLATCGSFFKLGPNSNINNPSNVFVGEQFFTGPYCYISTSNFAKVVIGDGVMLGPNVTILGGNHNIELSTVYMIDLPKRQDADIGVVIENNVWVGAGAIILDGAYLSEGSVIAAGAVVNVRTEPNSVYGGVPAKFLKYRTHFK